MILAPQEQIALFTARGWWGTDTLDDLFRRNVSAAPARLAITDPPNRADITGGPPRRLTYAEFDQEVDRYASLFLGKGLGKDDVIAVQLANTVELVAIFLAAWRLGLIVSPMPLQWRTHELRDILNFVGAKAVITARHIRGHDHGAMFETLRVEAPALDHFIIIDELTLPQPASADLAAYRRSNPVDANDAATICWTSGTEARPKGVPRSHNHWLVAGVACSDAAAIEPGSVVLMPFPLINMAAIGGILTPWLMCGGTLVLHHPFDLGVFLRKLADERVSYTVAPPAILNMLLKEDKLLASVDLSALKSVGSGSAALSPWMVKTWQDRYGLSIINIFGSNEGTCLVSGAADVPDPEDRALYFPRFGVAGLTWPARISGWIETKLVDLQTGDAITAPNQPGELLIRGATIFSGYFRAGDGGPADAIDAEGYFHTGDVFEIAGPGNRFYRFVERAKDIIIRGGMNISPGEIDGLLAGHPKIADAAIVGVPDEILGERICAVIVTQPGESISLGELREFLTSRDVAIYKLPERLEIKMSLPRNPLGKVLRRVLREGL